MSPLGVKTSCSNLKSSLGGLMDNVLSELVRGGFCTEFRCITRVCLRLPVPRSLKANHLENPDRFVGMSSGWAQVH
jgi:hypothetical protein